MNWAHLIALGSIAFVGFGLHEVRAAAAINAAADDRILFVVSLDGFRPDYLTRNMTKTLNFFGQSVIVGRMSSVFPTQTFVNHFSIATGKYAGTHGVLGNSLYDAKLGHLGYGHDLFHNDPAITPIWTLNELNAGHSGCMMWAGSEFEYRGHRCTHTQTFDAAMKPPERVDMAIGWMKDARAPANLVMFYADQPDQTGHAYGCESPQMNKQIAAMDATILYLLQRLQVENLHQRTDIIIVSDHGMLTTTPAHFIDLYQFIGGPEAAKMYGTSPVLQVVANDPSRQDAVCEQLKAAGHKDTRFAAYDSGSVPRRWRIENARRFGPCVVVANPPWAFQDYFDARDWFPEVQMTANTEYGLHGYDNNVDSMRPLFMARGPSFRKAAVIDTEFQNIDLFSLFCRLLGIDAIAIDGDDPTHVWNGMLRANVTATEPVNAEMQPQCC